MMAEASTSNRPGATIQMIRPASQMIVAMVTGQTMLALSSLRDGRAPLRWLDEGDSLDTGYLIDIRPASHDNTSLFYRRR